MTRAQLRIWAAAPPSKTPQAMTVAQAVIALLADVDRLEEWRADRAKEFVPLAQANLDRDIAVAAVAALQSELARVRAEKLPPAEWEVPK